MSKAPLPDSKTEQALHGYLISNTNGRTQLIEKLLPQLRAAVERDDLRGAFEIQTLIGEHLRGVFTAIYHAAKIREIDLDPAEEADIACKHSGKVRSYKSEY